MNHSILLIGGTNVDYIATSQKKLLLHSSNIGELEISYGGVMRNVVENLARLGNDCIFFTAVGEDVAGEKIKNYMTNLGIKLVLPKTNNPTSSYICINDYDRDMFVGLNDMRIMEDLSPDFIHEYKKTIDGFDYVVLDSNICKETLKCIFNECDDKKFICEAISANKIIRYLPYLDKIYLLKCNIKEARALFNSEESAAELTLKILKTGVKKCVITQGKDDIYYGENGEVYSIKVEPIKEILGNTTGCGDAMFAGIIDKLMIGENLKEAIEFGNKLSALTLKTKKANNEEVSKLAYKH